MARITHIIVHCSDSACGDAALIRKWHTDPVSAGGRGWPNIGYHYVICNGNLHPNKIDRAKDGAVQVGVFMDRDNFIRGSEVGAHTLGYNAKAIGICLIGKKDFTVPQFTSLGGLIRTLQDNHRIPLENVLGHYETESGRAQGKTCPNFDMAAFRKHLKAART